MTLSFGFHDLDSHPVPLFSDKHETGEMQEQNGLNGLTPQPDSPSCRCSPLTVADHLSCLQIASNPGINNHGIVHTQQTQTINNTFRFRADRVQLNPSHTAETTIVRDSPPSPQGFGMPQWDWIQDSKANPTHAEFRHE